MLTPQSEINADTSLLLSLHCLLPGGTSHPQPVVGAVTLFARSSIGRPTFRALMGQLDDDDGPRPRKELQRLEAAIKQELGFPAAADAGQGRGAGEGGRVAAAAAARGVAAAVGGCGRGVGPAAAWGAAAAEAGTGGGGRPGGDRNVPVIDLLESEDEYEEEDEDESDWSDEEGGEIVISDATGRVVVSVEYSGMEDLVNKGKYFVITVMPGTDWELVERCVANRIGWPCYVLKHGVTQQQLPGLVRPPAAAAAGGGGQGGGGGGGRGGSSVAMYAQAQQMHNAMPWIGMGTWLRGAVDAKSELERLDRAVEQRRGQQQQQQEMRGEGGGAGPSAPPPAAAGAGAAAQAGGQAAGAAGAGGRDFVVEISSGGYGPMHGAVSTLFVVKLTQASTTDGSSNSSSRQAAAAAATGDATAAAGGGSGTRSRQTGQQQTNDRSSDGSEVVAKVLVTYRNNEMDSIGPAIEQIEVKGAWKGQGLVAGSCR